MSRSISLVPAIGRSPTLSPLDRIMAVVSWIGREARRQRELHALESLDGRALADIGIGRSEAEPAVRHGRSALPSGARAITGSNPSLPLMPPSWTEWR